MKAAFDKLPLLIIERLNSLIDEIESGEVCGAIPTGIDGASTLAELFTAFTSGTLASVIAHRDTTLTAYLEALRADVDRLVKKVEGGDNE